MRISLHIDDCTVDEAAALVEGYRDLKSLGTSPARALATEAKKDIPKAPTPPPAPPAAPADSHLTPAVKTLALELGIAEAHHVDIPGTGKDGRVTQGDVKAYAKRAATAGDPSTPGPVDPGHAPADPLDFDGPADAATLDDCRNALKALNEAKGMPACLKVLAKVGAPNVGKVPADKFDEFVAFCGEEAG